MTQLALARPDQVDGIYRESHVLWGAGLPLGEYRGLWDELQRTAWGEKYACFVVWLADDGSVLSSMKVYRPLLRLLGGTRRATALGAVFTPAARRGRRHATEMVRAALTKGRERGDAAALLFSDIGIEYYSALGFHPLPAEEQWGPLPRGTPRDALGFRLRAMGEGDLEPACAAHEAFCADRPFAVVRDIEHWRFLWTRTRGFFDRLDRPGLTPRLQVATRDGAFAGYLIGVEGGGEWSVREVGAVGGNLDWMAAIVRLGAAAAARAGLRSFYGWLPRELVERLDDFKVRSRPRARAVPMIQSLAAEVDLEQLASPRACYLSFQDQF